MAGKQPSRCPSCGQRLSLAGGHGSSPVCPGCGQSLSDPDANELVFQTWEPPREEPEAERPLARPPLAIDHDELIDMTAMVDIVFFLLIFFLVTSMQSLGSAIPLPAPSTQAGASSNVMPTLRDHEADAENITVFIDKEDRIRIGPIAVDGPADLRNRLQELMNRSPRPTKMLVVGSSDATHGTAVMVLDAGHEAGLEHVRLSVSDEADR